MNTKSTCDSQGWKVVFTLMRSMKSQSGCYTDACNAEKMARGLFDRFGVGKAGCNDGLLFLLSVDDR